MLHRLSTLLFAVVLLTLPSCYSVEHADLAQYSQDQGFPVSTEEPPANTESIGLVHAEETGFYIIGMFPVVRATLQGCLDRMLRAARKRGADGVADVKYLVSPAQLFKFTVFPLPDWTARVYVTGTAYRRRSGLPQPVDPTTQPMIRTAPAPGKSR